MAKSFVDVVQDSPRIHLNPSETQDRRAGPDASSTSPPRGIALDAHRALSSSSQV